MDFRLRAVNNIQSLYYRMYSNSHKQTNPASKLSIFQIAENIRQEEEGRNEASQIMSAYRKVQDIRIPVNSSNNQIKKKKQAKTEQRKPESQYANKVKETLRQLNANRKKELQSNKDIPRPVIDEKVKVLGSAERHLVQSGLRKLNKLLVKKYDQNIKLALQKIINAGTSTNLQNQQTIRLWKLRRIFSAWQYEAMLCKIEKQRLLKDQSERQKRQDRLAADFCYFRIIKKFFKGWSYETRKALKKRQFQLEEAMKRQEETKKMEAQNKIGGQNQRKRQFQSNIELQNKLRGFLDGLKQEIQGKDRLNTIKQKTQQSEARKEAEQSRVDRQESQVIEAGQNSNSNQTVPEIQQNQVVVEQEHHYGPLTSEQLEKKRKQLEKKAKQRKQALEKLKKDREQKKKQELEQKIALQKQIDQQQKRIKQEQYRKFLKQRRQEEEWKQKQKRLEKQAVEFDRLRLMRFYGWQFWTKLKAENQKKAEEIGNLLSKIIMKRRLQKFVSGIIEIGELKLKEAQTKAHNSFIKKLKRKCVQKLRQWKRQQIEMKDELEARHEVNMVKIYFKQWMRTRNQIQLQNYEWERPRLKRAQCLHAMTLMHKALQALKMHRDEQIQNRNIQQHKAKIKQKVHQIVQEKPTINYDDFL